MSHPTHPLFVDLTGRRVLVVGAGAVGTRRTARLLDAGAVVDVVAPTASAEVTLWDADESVTLTWHPRRFQVVDVDAAWLAHAATGDADVDASVVAAADARRVWSVRASAAEHSPAWSAASVVTDDGVTVAVTGGGDPRRAQAVRDGIAAQVRAGEIPLRRRRKPAPGGGDVSLVGAGPGDPDLLTLRGWRRLREADVVVVDHLVPASLLDHLDADVEVHYAGKLPGHHYLTQTQINQLIVQRAQEGHRVVRLKGGDPFILGRGSEEAQACVRAGVPVEVVPGITSVASVPAAAGIPLTHRGVTSSFVLVSGHAGLPEIVSQVDGAPGDATIVMLMGTKTIRAVAEHLVSRGRSADTPAAIIERGWTRQQRVLTGTLDDIADIAERAGARPPAVVVIGEVVRLRYEIGDVARISPDAAHTVADDVAPRPLVAGRTGAPAAGAERPEVLVGA
jgi:uroporphyrin-III C-methyltransferase/precorrin-2 dehydrogenase/sirohydrochlorin ferrochelatase